MTQIKCEYYSSHVVKSKKWSCMVHEDRYCAHRDSRGYCKLETIKVDTYTDGDTTFHVAQCCNWKDRDK
jgi:hypothetical protein